MKKLRWLVASTTAFGSFPALAQTADLENLARRVAALEQENAALKREMARLSSPNIAVPAPVQTAVAVPAPSMKVTYGDAAPVKSWDGAYIGFNAGGAMTRYERVDIDNQPISHTNANGVSFGAQLGRRWQSGGLVTGVELEAAFPQIETIRGLRGPATRFDTQVFGRVKGQIGADIGRFLIYGTAGLQITQFRVGYSNLQGRRGNSTNFLYGVGLAKELKSGTSIEIEAVQSDVADVPLAAFLRSRTRSIVVRVNKQLR